MENVLDFFAPYINSQVQDDNPAGVSQSLPTATGGFADSATKFLGTLLDFNLKRDQQQYTQELQAKGQAVATPMWALQSPTGGVNTSKVLMLGLGAVLLVGAVIAVKKLS